MEICKGCEHRTNAYITLKHTEDLAVHHHLPRIHREIGVVETPVEFLRGFWLIGGVMVWRYVFMLERLGRGDTLSWVEDEHFLEEVDRLEY